MTAPADYDHLQDLSKTDLMRIIVALSSEVYELKDRMGALESVLQEQGMDLQALDQPIEPAAYDPERLQARDSFVERVFAALAK